MVCPLHADGGASLLPSEIFVPLKTFCEETKYDKEGLVWFLHSLSKLARGVLLEVGTHGCFFSSALYVQCSRLPFHLIQEQNLQNLGTKTGRKWRRLSYLILRITDHCVPVHIF